MSYASQPHEPFCRVNRFAVWAEWKGCFNIPAQVQGGKKVYLGLEKEEAMLGKSFGQNLLRLIFGS